MTSATLLRSAISVGWVVNAVLIERIVTRGGITDLSEIGTNGPVFALVGASLVVTAVVLAIIVALGRSAWPAASLVGGIAYVLIGLWMRSNGDDSGAAVVLAAAAITALSLVVLGRRRRPAAQR